MKKIALTVFLLTSLISAKSNAQYPMDFVSDDALAIVLVRNGNAINSSIQHISKQGDFLNGVEVTNWLASNVFPFIENPSAIDDAEELLIVVEPTILEDGQKPVGMFGPMPHIVVICKPKQGQLLSLKKDSHLASGSMHEGWFIASPSVKWTKAASSGNSPLIKLLPDSQLAVAVDIQTLWQQLGPIAQMTGGLLINTMNKPDASGVVPPDTKKNTKQANKAFTESMKWLGKLKFFVGDLDLLEYKLSARTELILKSPTHALLDNSTLNDMASRLSDDMLQYGMSDEFTRKFLEYDFSGLDDGFDNLPFYPILLLHSIKMLRGLTKENVASCNLSKKNGLTIARLAEVENQTEFMAKLPLIMEELTGFLLNEFSVELNPNPSEQNTWDITMIGSDSEDEKIMNGLFPKNDQWKYSALDDNKIATAIGPQTWKPLSQKHSTPLSQLIKQHDGLKVDFAITLDARSFVFGLAEIVKSVEAADDVGSIDRVPATRLSLIIGDSSNSTQTELHADLLGLAKLFSDIDNAKD